MKKTVTISMGTFRHFLFLGIIATFIFTSCTPEGVINKTKYQGEKITNTCDQFKEEVDALMSANSNTAQLVVAEYDNTDLGYYYLEPGQYEIKDGMLNWRFAGDLEYEKYLHKGIAVHVSASYEALDHLKGMEKTNSGDIGMLVVDRAYYDAHKEPVFMYQMPISGSEEAIEGKQIKLKFTVVKYKKGKIKKVFCNSDEVPLGPVSPACCTFQPWDKANPSSVISMPEVDIQDENYKYRGFTGTLDLIFPMGSVKYDTGILSSAIQDYIRKYQEKGFQVTSINLDGYASLGGVEAKNIELSERRAKAVYEDLVSSMKDSTLNIQYAGRGEDWERLVLLTKASALDAQEQGEVLAVANGAGTNDEKEAEMRKLSFWEKLVEEVIVNTRHTFVTFKFDYMPDKMYVEYYPSKMPVNSDELVRIANETMVIGAYKESDNAKAGLKVLDILIGNNKKANLFAMRSTYRFGSDDVTGAIGDIDQALSLDGGNMQYAMASLAYKTKYAGTYSLDERLNMMTQYNDYAVRYPDNSGLMFNRAVMMDKIGYISGALAEYGELLEGAEPNAAQINNRGVAKLKTMRTTEAEADFMAALQKDNTLAEAHFNLALINAYRGMTNKTVQHLDQAVMHDASFKKMIFSNPAFRIMKENPKFDKFR